MSYLNEEEQYQLALGKALIEASEVLPNGYTVVFEVKRKGAAVFLRDKQRLLTDPDAPDILADIKKATELAKKAEVENG